MSIVEEAARQWRCTEAEAERRLRDVVARGGTHDIDPDRCPRCRKTDARKKHHGFGGVVKAFCRYCGETMEAI